jgi:hypothetical protein
VRYLEAQWSSAERSNEAEEDGVEDDRLRYLGCKKRFRDAAELSKIVAFAFGIDRDTFVFQTVQHSIQVIHSEVDHRFLRWRKVSIILPEEGEDDLSALR